MNQLVVCIVQSLEYARIVDAAVTRNGEAALENRLAELEALGVSLFHHVGTDVLEVNVADTRAELLGCLDGVLLGEGEVAGIKAEVNVTRIGVVHQALGSSKV